jgi:hypothetical protein
MHGVMLIPIANNNSVMRTLQRTGIVKYIMTLKALRFLAQEKLPEGLLVKVSFTVWFTWAPSVLVTLHRWLH